MRFHTQTAAATLTKPQPLNNIVRTAIQALAAVLGGTQSLHTNGLDEAYAIPSELAMKVALRTQQIIADETNVTQVIDPLGGSYYVEALTREIEKRHRGLPGEDRRAWRDAAGDRIELLPTRDRRLRLRLRQRKASGERTVVGVNKYVDRARSSRSKFTRSIRRANERKIDRLKDGQGGRATSDMPERSPS